VAVEVGAHEPRLAGQQRGPGTEWHVQILARITQVA
jgi:hypothetical protein